MTQRFIKPLEVYRGKYGRRLIIKGNISNISDDRVSRYQYSNYFT